MNRFWKGFLNMIRWHDWKIYNHKCRRRKPKKNDHEVTIAADHDWLKPMCKECPYFIPGGDSKDKDSFMKKGPTRCTRPIGATGARCLGKHVMRRRHTLKEALENV